MLVIDRRCGNCVVWNAGRGDTHGGCARLGRIVAASAMPCDQWFGLAQLIAANARRPAAR